MDDGAVYKSCQKGGAHLAGDFDRRKQALSMLGHLRRFAGKQ